MSNIKQQPGYSAQVQANGTILMIPHEPAFICTEYQDVDSDDSDYDPIERCDICHLTECSGDYNYQKCCDVCKRICCTDTCVALTACQYTGGVCRDCFIYKCIRCNTTPLPVLNGPYLADGDVEYVPLCDKCKTIVFSGKKPKNIT